MKLTSPDRQPRRRGPKAAEALRPAEQPAESFFDIRQFLQSNDVQFMKMMATVVNPQPDDHEVFMSMSWLGRLDPEINENLKNSLGFKEYILQKFETTYQESFEREEKDEQDPNFFIGLAQVYILLFQGVQTFPELSHDAQVQEKLRKDYPTFLEVIGDTTVPLVDRIPMASIFSVLLPEHKTELIAALLEPYEGQVTKLLSEPDLQTGDNPTPALGLLLFPQEADQIKRLLRPQEAALAEEWEVTSKKQKHQSELEDYFNQAFILSLLTAEKVTVSPEGLLEFELKPAPASAPNPLPERPLT